MRRLKTDRPAFYMSPDAAAEYMGVSRKTIDRWRKSGLVSCVRIGGRLIRFRRLDLDAMMQAHLCRVSISEEA